MEGERNIKFAFNDVEASFDAQSTIKFYKENELIMQLDPTDLSVLYHAYMGMLKERKELADSDDA